MTVDLKQLLLKWSKFFGWSKKETPNAGFFSEGQKGFGFNFKKETSTTDLVATQFL